MNNTKLFLIISFFVIFIGVISIFLAFKNKDKSQSVISSFKPVSQMQSPADFPQEGPISESTNSAQFQGERETVSKVVDGDTIELQSGKTVRFIGIDTPETVDPRRPVGCFGKEASNETKKLLSGKQVVLQKDVSETDKYKRLLRYVYLPLDDGQTLFVNDYLVREGYAKIYTYPPDVKFNEQFREAEKFARENKKGLWGKC